MNSTEEDAADEDPEHDGQPAKCHCHDGARNRTSTADGAELVRECGEGGDRREILAVLHTLGRCESVLIDTPLVGKPTSIAQIAADENRCSYDHEQYSVHRYFLLKSAFKTYKKTRVVGCARRPSLSSAARYLTG